LITSTALTLLVIPALYARFGGWLLPNPERFHTRLALSQP
jgi:nickel/cobalt tolerance cation efflux system protein